MCWKEEVNRRIDQLRARLPRGSRAEFDRLVDVVRRYVAFREDGKDFLMLGYDLLRDTAREFGNRLEVGEDIFYLTRQDMFDALRVGFAPHHLIETRKNAYRAEARLQLPRVLDEKSIDGIGVVPEVKNVDGYKAFAVSSGNAAGPARVLHSPIDAGELGRGYILVCPSTDPSWTPLFVNAAGLVLECGGTLSHGAVVAREMGLPAVVLPDATRLFSNGEEIRVDGVHGAVSRVAGDEKSDAAAADALQHGDPGRRGDAVSSDTTAAGAALPRRGQGAEVNEGPCVSAVDSNDTHIPHEMVPPPSGPKDRAAAKIRNICAIAWTVYLLCAFLLPERWLYQPTMTLLDWILWPISRSLGRPAVVAIVAAGLALATQLLQKFITDNRRLVVAKRRAAQLNKLAKTLPQKSPRRMMMSALGSPVQWRTLLAALAPVAILLGPMTMTFFWFLERLDPAKWNAEPGAEPKIIAMVDSTWIEPVKIRVAPPLELDDTSPASRTLKPIKETLEHLLDVLRNSRPVREGPFELEFVPDVGREQSVAALKAYLKKGIPPQGITWQIRVPKGLTGRFPVVVEAGERSESKRRMESTVMIVLGDTDPPSPTDVDGASGSPVKELKVSYPERKAKPVFWEPLERLKKYAWLTKLREHIWLDSDWLVVYLLAYLPTLFLLRAILRLA